MTLVLPVVAGVVGVLIGMTGVGGVLLPPVLVVVSDMDPHAATATSTWAFAFTGVVGTAAYAMRGVVPWPMLLRLSAGLLPGAFLGARVNALLPASLVLAGLAALTLFVGVQQLLPATRPARGRTLNAGQLAGLGALVGFGSAITGTGGPVLLVPALLVLGVSPLTAVAVSQAAQLPVVAAGSVGYLQAGLTDIGLGTTLGLVAAAGTVVGAVVATRLRGDVLRRAVALACVAAGAFLLLRIGTALM